MKIYIVEDEIFHLEDLQITLEELGHECVGHNDDPFEAQEQIGQSKPDVVLMDIHLNDRQAGIALARRIKGLYQLPVIFTSSDRSMKVMSDAVDINPVAYLTKPINSGDLQGALLLAQKQIKTNQEEVTSNKTTLFIKNGSKLVKVEMKDILYAYSDTKNYCSLLTIDGKKLTFRNSILGFHKLLDPQLFIQTHRAYLINLSHMDYFYENDQTIELKGNHIPVGRTFRSALLKRMKVL